MFNWIEGSSLKKKQKTNINNDVCRNCIEWIANLFKLLDQYRYDIFYTDRYLVKKNIHILNKYMFINQLSIYQSANRNMDGKKSI